MRVIGGRWRGREIRAPRATPTRPTSARLREALFSAIAPWLPGAHVLDLFAGSGALGIEALSRGAAHVEFTDLEPAALRAIGENLEALDADPSTWRIRRGDAWRRIARLERGVPEGAIVLLDPPYALDVLDRCLPEGAGALESGRIVAFAVEHEAGAPEPGPQPAGVEARRRRHGHGAFTLLTRSDT